MEEWRDIKGYEGLYQVSSYGRVKSLDYGRTGKEQLLKQQVLKNGYFITYLSKNSKLKGYLVHRLVAQAFLPNYDNLPQVNHKDENKQNNCVDNLEWCSAKDNSNHGTRNERIKEKRSKPLLQLSFDGKLVKEWPSIQEAVRQSGYDYSSIWGCCKGQRKSHKGFKWQYV